MPAKNGRTVYELQCDQCIATFPRLVSVYDANLVRSKGWFVKTVGNKFTEILCVEHKCPDCEVPELEHATHQADKPPGCTCDDGWISETERRRTVSVCPLHFGPDWDMDEAKKD